MGDREDAFNRTLGEYHILENCRDVETYQGQMKVYLEARADCLQAIEKAGGDHNLSNKLADLNAKATKLTQEVAGSLNYPNLVKEWGQAKDKADFNKGVYKKQHDFGVDAGFNLDDNFQKEARVESGRRDEGGAGGNDMTIGLNGTLGIGGMGAGQIGGNMTVDDSMQDLVGLMSNPKKNDIQGEADHLGTAIADLQQMALQQSDKPQAQHGIRDSQERAMQQVERDSEIASQTQQYSRDTAPKLDTRETKTNSPRIPKTLMSGTQQDQPIKTKKEKEKPMEGTGQTCGSCTLF